MQSVSVYAMGTSGKLCVCVCVCVGACVCVCVCVCGWVGVGGCGCVHYPSLAATVGIKLRVETCVKCIVLCPATSGHHFNTARCKTAIKNGLAETIN